MKNTYLIVAPHPDDETIGAAIWMERHADLDITLLHVTDGSPRDKRDARSHGFTSRRAYAAARRRELTEALGFLSRGSIGLRAFSYVDKESYLHLPEIIARTAALMEKLRPAIVLSPAYEGGHPDHDASALAVAAARARVSFAFRHQEYRLYHSGPDGEMATDSFLPCASSTVEIHSLCDAERERKRRMLLAFKTQQAILSRFSVDDESFREAPVYDFTQPPHQGELLYERWNIGVSGEEWRRRAVEALGAPDGISTG